MKTVTRNFLNYGPNGQPVLSVLEDMPVLNAIEFAGVMLDVALRIVKEEDSAAELQIEVAQAMILSSLNGLKNKTTFKG